MDGKYNSRESYKYQDATRAAFTSTVAPNNSEETMSSLSMKGFWVAVVGAFVSSLTALIMILVLVFKYFGGLGWKGNAQFNCHALFMITGLVFLFGNAIILYRVLAVVPKTILKIAHGALLLSAFVFVLVAMVAIFEYKKASGSTDMYSLHSWIGMSTAILFFLQYVVGFTSFFLQVVPLQVRALLLPFHRYFGLAIFVMALASALTGMNEKLMWTLNYSSFTTIGYIGNSFALVVVLNGLLVAFLLTKETYKRAPRPEELPVSPRHSGVNS